MSEAGVEDLLYAAVCAGDASAFGLDNRERFG
jgi:hypothetical protein